MNPWPYLAVAIVAEVIGTSLLKSTEGFTRVGPLAIVVVAYAVAFWGLAMALRSLPVGVAYAIWAGLGIVLMAVVGRVVFRQPLDAAAILGIGLILAGVLVINLLSASVRQGG